MAAFSSEQIDQLREVFREELGNAGLRIDEPDHVDDARRDFMFLRSFRKGVDGTAAKIGWLVIVAVCSGVFWLISQGLNMWRGS